MLCHTNVGKNNQIPVISLEEMLLTLLPVLLLHVILIFLFTLQQWVDLARFTGLQAQKNEKISSETSDSPKQAALECNASEDANIDEISKQ